MTDDVTTPEAIADWIQRHVAANDEFAAVADATEAHRVAHGCDTFAGGDGPLLRVLAAAIRPRRILEVGTALGYSALNLAAGAGSGASVDTVEADPSHAELARQHVLDHGMASRIRVHVGRDLDVLGGLDERYDLIFYDAAVPTPAHLDVFDGLLAADGVLLSSNLFLGQYAPDMPGLEEGARYRELLFGGAWQTAFIGGKALSVRRTIAG